MSNNDGVVQESISFEEASRCPKCKQPGELGTERPAANKSTIHIIWCRNTICRWYNTNWIVQKLQDGTVPVRQREERRPKTFPKIIRPSGHDDRVREILKRDADDTKPGP